jgi:hypothetical protein
MLTIQQHHNTLWKLIREDIIMSYSSVEEDIKAKLVLSAAFASNTALLLSASNVEPVVVIGSAFATAVLPWVVGSARIKESPTADKN